MNTKQNVDEMANSTTITVRIDPTTKKRLEAVASTLNRSKSFIANEAIEEFLAVQEWQVAGIQQGIASLDAGRQISHDDVLAWVQSWGTKDEKPAPTV